MRDRAVTAPAGAVERLRGCQDRIDRVVVAANTVGLDDPVGLPGGTDGDRIGFKGEGEYILHTGIAFIHIIAEDILVRQVAVGADGVLCMRAVVPILVLGIHDVAVVTGGGLVPQVGGRIRCPGEDAQRGQENQDANEESQFLDHLPLLPEKKKICPPVRGGHYTIKKLPVTKSQRQSDHGSIDH
jgi:hypothetical protein